MYLLILIFAFVIVFALHFFRKRNLTNALTETAIALILFVPNILDWLYMETRTLPIKDGLIVIDTLKRNNELFPEVSLDSPFPFLENKPLIEKPHSIDLKPIEKDLNKLGYFSKENLAIDCYTYKQLHRVKDNLFETNNDCIPFNVLWFDIENGQYVLYLTQKSDNSALQKIVLHKERPQIISIKNQKYALVISRSDLQSKNVEEHFAEIIIFKIKL